MQPTSSSQTIAELEAMTSPIKAFIEERCEVNPHMQVPITDLFHAWRDWCSTCGYPQTGNVQSFGKNLRAAFPEIEVCRPQDGSYRERHYRGISLLSQQRQTADVRGREWPTFIQ